MAGFPVRSVMPCVTDQLVLRTIDGAADLLLEELRAMPSIPSVRQTSATTVECTVDGPPDELISCGLYSTVAVRNLEQSLRVGVLSTLKHPVGFRVGADDPVRRRALIAATEQRFGWVNRPGSWDVNLIWSGDGWIAEFGPLSWTRRFGRLERLPWSTNLIAAEVLARLAKLQPKQVVLDPFCGTGTILLSARRREPSTRIIGSDHDPQALELATRNLRTERESRAFVRAAAGELPIAPGSVDRVITNLPFGKQVGSHRINRSLYPAALAEVARVLTAAGRAVLLTEDKRVLRAAVDQQRSLKIARQRLLRYGGAAPTAYILTRTRSSRPR